MPRYWSCLIIRDKFSTQKVEQALHMAKGHFEEVKLCNLSADGLIRLGGFFRHASHAVKTLYYETTDSYSIIALASLGINPESLIIRNEDPRGPPRNLAIATLIPIFGPTLRTLSIHRLQYTIYNWKDYVPLLGHLTSLTMTGSRFVGMGLLHYTTTIEEIVLDFTEDFLTPYEVHITPPDFSLPSLRVFELRHVPCPTEMGLPTIRLYAPMLRTFHLDSTSAALWLLAFSDRGAPTALVDFRVDKPSGSTVTLSHLQPFLCNTIERFALTSISHELGPLLRDIEARVILPRRKHLEFTFHDE